ncbi:MAG: SIS domain-containing protein [bacterium]|nr:SIS domain-containing protein [bacterium]
MLDEIKQQPESLDRLLRSGQGRAAEIASALAPDSYHYILIAARGTSDNAARYAQYLWGARNRRQVALAAPSLFSTYHQPPNLDGALVIGISQSGQSPDLVAVMQEAKAQGRPTVTITNEPNSPMAVTSDWVLPIDAGTENAVAATKTYTGQLLAIALLSAAWSKSAEDSAALRSVADLAAQALNAEAASRRASEAMAEVVACAVLGRGYNRATTFEWALKLQETTYTLAQPYSTADFRHGPIAVIESGFPVLAVAPAGTVYDEIAELAAQLRTERGATTFGITNVTDTSGAFDHLLPIPNSPEWLSPIPAIIAGQLFSYYTAHAKGHDPDEPRGLSKVTRTV